MIAAPSDKTAKAPTAAVGDTPAAQGATPPAPDRATLLTRAHAAVDDDHYAVATALAAKLGATTTAPTSPAGSPTASPAARSSRWPAATAPRPRRCWHMDWAPVV